MPVTGLMMQAIRNGGASATPTPTPTPSVTVSSWTVSSEFSGLTKDKMRDGNASTRWSTASADDGTIIITLSSAASLRNIGIMIANASGNLGIGQFQLYYADGGAFTQVAGAPSTGVGGWTMEGWIFSFAAGQTKWVDQAVGIWPDQGAHTQWKIVPTNTMDNAGTGVRFWTMAEIYFALDVAHTQLITGP